MTRKNYLSLTECQATKQSTSTINSSVAAHVHGNVEFKICVVPTELFAMMNCIVLSSIE